MYGRMIRAADQTLVAVINGALLTRSSGGGLYSLADDESQELIDLARFCCNDNGKLRKPLRAAINDPARVQAAGRGGLLFLDEVHVLPSFRGQNLSLELSLALFRYLDMRWSLVVSIVVPYAFEDQQRDAPLKRTAEERTHLCRHFARLGLKQVADGIGPHAGSYWFLESSQMTGALLPREDVASLEVLLPAPQPKPEPEPTELDQKLVTAVGAGTEDNLSEIAELLKAGANVEATRALHICAGLRHACSLGWTSRAMAVLIAGGADVNAVDWRNGFTALHVAAGIARSVAAVGALLEHGADPLARDLNGFTPINLFTRLSTANIQSMCDFEACHRPGWQQAGKRVCICRARCCFCVPQRRGRVSMTHAPASSRRAPRTHHAHTPTCTYMTCTCACACACACTCTCNVHAHEHAHVRLLPHSIVRLYIAGAHVQPELVGGHATQDPRCCRTSATKRVPGGYGASARRHAGHPGLLAEPGWAGWREGRSPWHRLCVWEVPGQAGGR